MKKIITSLCHVTLCGLILLSFGCANKSATLTAHVPTKQQAEYKKDEKNPALISSQAPIRSIAYVNTHPTKSSPNKGAVVAQKTSSKSTTTVAVNTPKQNNSKEATLRTNPASPRSVAQNTSTKGAVVIPKAKSAIGIRYSYGGTTKRGFDCSGFVQWVYKHAGVKLPRTAREQSRSGVAVKSKSDMKVGDIVAFRHPRIGYHTGIYIGDNKFIHSPRRNKRIQVTDLSVSYFSRNYIGARRVAELGVAEKNAADKLLSQYSGKDRD